MNKQRRERIEKRKKLKEWGDKIKIRDGNKCVICNKVDRVNPHHIIPRKIKLTMFHIDNGISLCPSHHKYNCILSAHKNPLAFFIWMELNRKEQLAKVKEMIWI